ncbi:MAG: radical SAM family heme chaperone HemW [Owenweeksia sp.]
MAGLYIHIPFCRKACIYCDFHFSTSLKFQARMVNALVEELKLQKKFTEGEKMENLYFGGGTPSVLTADQLDQLTETAFEIFEWEPHPEVTLEANPDDLTRSKLTQLAESKINRLSIGIQSFRDEDLQLMNRSHNAAQAVHSIKLAQDKGFTNITLDLIYGMPGMNDEVWEQQVEQAIALGVPHISSYALTVEPHTVLHHKIEKGDMPEPDEDQAARQFEILWKRLQKAGFEHYEVSNFAKPAYRARHNSSYWKGVPYLGVGPSAHSFHKNKRFWNISNNMLYMQAVENGNMARESEVLLKKDHFNEHIMTQLRTQEGIHLEELATLFSTDYQDYLMKEAEPLLKKAQLNILDRRLYIPQEWRFHTDGIAASLFYI